LLIYAKTIIMKINDIIQKLGNSNGKLITFKKSKRIELHFKDLFPIIKRASLWLNKNSLNSTTTLGILANNGFEWVVADLACIWGGVKIFPIQKGEDINLYLSTSLKFSAVLIGSDYMDSQEEIEKFGIQCILLNELIPEEDNIFKHAGLNIMPGDENLQPYNYNDKEIFSYKSTSGSTGFPKVIGQSVESTENSIRNGQDLFQHKDDDSILVYLPLNLLHQRYWLYSAIIYQFTVIIVPSRYVFEAIKQEKPTVIMGVPHIYEVIRVEFIKSLGLNIGNDLYDNNYSEVFKGYLGGKIRCLWTGSAPIAVDVIEFYFKLGVPMYQGYGMTETCIIAKNFPGNNKIGSVGKPWPNLEIIFDDENQILVKSKFPVSENYAMCSEEDKQTFRDDGYVATGDIGYMDKDGFLFIKGRKKEMIVLSNSKKIYPSEIETKLRCNKEIIHCILYGNEHPYLVALIIPATGITEETIKIIINEHNNISKQENQIYRFLIKHADLSDAISNQNKILRSKVYKKYATEFEKLYD